MLFVLITDERKKVEGLLKEGKLEGACKALKHNPALETTVYQHIIEMIDGSLVLNLGKCYFYGKGVAKDMDKAIALIGKASEMGNDEAMYTLGVCYEVGNGVKNNAKKAVELYQRSTNLGNGNAVHNLAMCYRYGKGVDKDIQKSMELFSLALSKDCSTLTALDLSGKNRRKY